MRKEGKQEEYLVHYFFGRRIEIKSRNPLIISRLHVQAIQGKAKRKRLFWIGRGVFIANMDIIKEQLYVV